MMVHRIDANFGLFYNISWRFGVPLLLVAVLTTRRLGIDPARARGIRTALSDAEEKHTNWRRTRR
jgi:hypothetical protein